MYAITRVTGRVEGTAAGAVLVSGVKIRAMVREPGKENLWAAQGAEVLVTDLSDVAALRKAFNDIAGDVTLEEVTTCLIKSV